MADSRTRTGNIQGEPEGLILPESQEVLRKQNPGVMSKKERREPEGAPRGQNWNNVSNEIK